MEAPGARTGTRFGPYELRSLLGKGGMGEVYEAYDTVKDRVVAVKLLSEELAKDPIYQVRFRRESQAAARLAEPHVIPIHDWGVIDGVLFIDMRLVPGVDLRTVLRSSGPMSPARAVNIVEQIASALDAAHADGLVHRDVKPANILVTPAEFAYLADFGIAHTEGDAAVTVVGMAVGSYIYMAPERFDAGQVTGRADIYSLAAVLHECLTGATPYPAGSRSVLIRSHLSDPPPRPSLQQPGIPPGMDEVIGRGMAKAPADRYPTATELARAARATLGIPAAAPPPPTGPMLVVRAPERYSGLPPESTGEISAVIPGNDPTKVGLAETTFTPLPSLESSLPPQPPAPYPGTPTQVRPFPDAHLFPDAAPAQSTAPETTRYQQEPPSYSEPPRYPAEPSHGADQAFGMERPPLTPESFGSVEPPPRHAAPGHRAPAGFPEGAAPGYRTPPGYSDPAPTTNFGEPQAYSERGGYQEAGYREPGGYRAPEPQGGPETRAYSEPGAYSEPRAYSEPGGYSEPRGYSESPGYSDQRAYSESPGYADQGYPDAPRYADQQGYQEPQAYSDQQAYSAQRGYADPGYDEYDYDEADDGYEPEQRRGRSIVLPIVVGILTVVVVAVGVVVGWQVFGSGDSGKTAAEESTGAPVTLATPGASTPNSPSAPTSTSPTTSSTKVVLPAGAKACDTQPGGGAFTHAASGSEVTSCAFAEEVRRAYAAASTATSRPASRSVVATSPVTGRTYTMNCTVEGQLVTCNGGDNAVVYVY